MDFKVVWSPAARSDLKNIVAYIAEEDPNAAAKLGYAIIEASKAVARFERKGRRVPEFRNKNIRELIVSPYRMIYRIRIDANILEIVRVWHGARGTPLI